MIVVVCSAPAGYTACVVSVLRGAADPRVLGDSMQPAAQLCHVGRGVPDRFNGHPAQQTSAAVCVAKIAFCLAP